MDQKLEVTSDLFVRHGKEIERILQEAVQEALLVHKRLGHSIVVWRDGEVVTLPPEEIPVDDPRDGVAAAD